MDSHRLHGSEGKRGIRLQLVFGQYSSLFGLFFPLRELAGADEAAVAAGGLDQCLAACRAVGEEVAGLAGARVAIRAAEDSADLAEAAVAAVELREAGNLRTR